MAKQNITLDEILTAMKGAKVSYQRTELFKSSGADKYPLTLTFKQPITDFDFITVESGDYLATNDVKNSDNCLSCYIPSSISYNAMYCDITSDVNSTPSSSNDIDRIGYAGMIFYKFTNSKTMVIPYHNSHILERVVGWKSVIEWGANILYYKILDILTPHKEVYRYVG